MDLFLFIKNNYEIIGSIIASITTILGVPFLIWKNNVAHKAVKATQIQINDIKFKNYIDNFNQAIGHLSSPELFTRLGGVKTLYNLLRINKTKEEEILSILHSFCKNSIITNEGNKQSEDILDCNKILANYKYQLDENFIKLSSLDLN